MVISALLLALVLVGLVPEPALADPARLEEFARLSCWQAPAYLAKDSVRFAPVDVIPAPERRPGFGVYRLRAGGYRGGAYARDDDGLTLVSALHPPGAERLPTHLWHVISLPRSPKYWDGLLANEHALVKAKLIAHDDDARRSAARWYEGGGARRYLVYNLASPADQGLVTARWRALVGSAIMSQVVEPSVVYDHHFYYVPLPARSLIRPGSWLHPSRRTINKPGVAYGFVLDDRGDCVGATHITVG